MKEIIISAKDKNLLCFVRLVSHDLSVSVADIINSAHKLQGAYDNVSQMLHSLPGIRYEGNVIDFTIEARLKHRDVRKLLEAIAMLRLTLNKNILQLIERAESALKHLKSVLDTVSISVELRDVYHLIDLNIRQLKDVQRDLAEA